MKRRGSSGGGGATRDVELERCRLVGTVFFSAIIVIDGLKYEKKNAHKKKHETKGHTKNCLEGINVLRGYLYRRGI